MTLLPRCLASSLALAFLAAGCGGDRGGAVSSAVQGTIPGYTVTELRVGDELARIVRDRTYGTPHVFGPSNRALFEAYGYVVAQDRLFQLELNRRAARGTLSEIFGPSTLKADTDQRTVGYTDDELRAIFAGMPADEQAIYEAYADGINRYVEEQVAASPLLLPFEFHALGFQPAPWTVGDSMAFGSFMVRRFGEIGGRERTNRKVLQALVAVNGEVDGNAVFDDVRWLDDPDAPVTLPDPASGRRSEAGVAVAARLVATRSAPASLAAGLVSIPTVNLDEAKAIWAALGVPTKLGSYAWVISPSRSAEGVAMLYGGPQMGASTPEVVHEVQLTGGSGFDVVGMAFAGVPAVLIGRTGHVAWTSTTATGDNVDVYEQTLCDAGGAPGYTFRGACTPYEVRTEQVVVRGLPAPVALPVLRSVHGPVVELEGGLAFAEKRAHWMREMEAGTAFLAFDRATNLEQFQRAVRRVVTSHNFLYVDQLGNIAYWQAGQVPVRPAGFDVRLPFPGDGTAEWPGGLVPVPTSVNPPQGWLANWNNKPSRGYPVADEQIFGKQGRLLEVAARLEGDAQVTVATMRDLPKDIGRVRGNGRDARFLRPYLLAALDAAPPAHPLAPAACALVDGWDGNAVASAVDSTKVQAGAVIFEAWLSRALANVFEDELGAALPEASPNLLIHVLDQAATGHSAVPPSRDYLNGVAWETVLSTSFDEAVAGLAAAMGGDPAAWTPDRPRTEYRHPFGFLVASIPQSNRATYAQVVVASRPRMEAWSIFSLGQSGFVGVAAAPPGFALDPNYANLSPMYEAFDYKPQPLLPRSEVR
jgi:penicillin G amidase